MVLSAFVALCSVVSVAQTKSVPDVGKVVGRVVDKTEGVPIRSAFAMVFSENSSKHEVTRVAPDGQFEISLTPGDYDVLIGAVGFAPTCKRVVGDPGEGGSVRAEIGIGLGESGGIGF